MRATAWAKGIRKHVEVWSLVQDQPAPQPVVDLHRLGEELRPPALAILNRSQNWLAKEIGVSPGYVSMLVNEGCTPSGRIRKRMLNALGLNDFHQLFRLEVQDDEP